MPTVIYQKFINRVDLTMNPTVLYLFGDNTKRRGMGGQAGHMRGEPNAVGVATKLTPTSGSNAYFSDADLLNNCKTIATDLLSAFSHRGIVVIPTDGLGTGLSELPERAPKTNDFLVASLHYLARGEFSDINAMLFKIIQDTEA